MHHGRVLYPILLLLTFSVTGCVKYGATLKLSSIDHNQKFFAEFSRSYITRDDAGDYQIVLLADPIDKVDLGRADRPIKPADVPPLRQIMTLRVLWRPMRGAQFDHPAATNSAIHWYVFDRTTDNAGWLHYAGNAFVAVYTESDRATIDVRNAQVKLVERQGNLMDPIGPAYIRGSFDALSDERRVADLLAEVKHLSPGATAEVSTGLTNKLMPPPRVVSPP